MDTNRITTIFYSHFPVLSKEFEKNNWELKPHQIKTIANVTEKDNTLCIMPTGGGKSLIYWLSGIITGGITIVVFPLISLIVEQEEKLQNENIDVLTLHSNLGSEKQLTILKKFANGTITPKFIFVSPEKLATDGFFEHCIRQRKKEIKLITVDEVHCVSQWGISFRPFYRNIPDFINRVFNDEKPKVLAMTATINPKELNDICKYFEISKDNVIKDQALMRSEITLHTIKFINENDKDNKLWDLLEIHKNEKTLIYVYRVKGKRSVIELSERANTQHGLKSMCFHGDMDANERKEILNKYKNNEINIIFATNAFGMGIDIPNVRVVIHFMIPESVEQYYQEIGRAARDKKAANAYLLYSNKNIDVKRKHFIDASFPKREELLKVYKKMTPTLPYFDDEEIQNCLHYFIDCGAIQIDAKGFSDLKMLSDIKNKKLIKIFESTKTKYLISSAKKSGENITEIIDLVYTCIVNDEVKLIKPPDRRLIISMKEEELSDEQQDMIINIIERKRKYKHDLLDYLLFVLENNTSSIELHQEIARYLGVDKNMLNKIYATTKGDKVRSKSEVIIANLLFQHDIKYEYELPLEYEIDKQIKPDFTIFLSENRKIFWEHLGLLGSETYDEDWLYKMKIYERHYPEMIRKTYEGVTITDSAMELIKEIKSLL